MSYKLVLIVSAVCTINFFSLGMEVEPTQEVMGMDVEPTFEAIRIANSGLLHAAEDGDFEKVKQLITEGIADVNALDDCQITALIFASMFGYKEIVKYLINAGADLNATCDGWTALMRACVAGEVDIAQILINAGADVNMIDEQGGTTFKCAVGKKNIPLIIALIKAGADINVVDSTNELSLIHAVKNKNFELFNALVNAKANVNVCDKNGETILWLAVKARQVGIVKTLIDNGSTQKDSALLLVAANSYCTYYDDNGSYIGANECVNLLIESGANLNIQRADKCTPLILACKSNNTLVALALIKAGADVHTIYNVFGDTALTCAVERNNIDVIKELIGAKAYIPSTRRTKVLELAINSKYPDLPIQVINSAQKPFAKKSIATLFMIYRNVDCCLSGLPQEVLKLIISIAYPEYAINPQITACSDPRVLVDTMSLETLAGLIKSGVLQQKLILKAWQEKLRGIVQELTLSKIVLSTYAVSDMKIQSFATDAWYNTIDALSQ